MYVEMEICPVCKAKLDAVTNIHCQREHGMTKKEVIEKYGNIELKNIKMPRFKGCLLYTSPSPRDRG